MPEKILVTGAGGFIGHHLVRFLKGKGYWVRGADIKYPEFSPKNEADEFLLLDLRDFRNCLEAVKGIDKIYNLAANMGGIGFITSVKADVVRDNILINTNMAEVSRLAGIKRLFFSSSACFPPGALVLSNPSSKSIEKLKKGDVVLDANGKETKVTETHQRWFKGELIKLFIAGLPEPILATPEHPFLIITDKKMKWKLAKDLREDDHLAFLQLKPKREERPAFYYKDYIPKYWKNLAYRAQNYLSLEKKYPKKFHRELAKKIGIDDTRAWFYRHGRLPKFYNLLDKKFEVDRGTAWLMGLYTAEGWIEHSKHSDSSRVVFALEKRDKVCQHLLDTLKEMGFESKIYKMSGQKGIKITVYSTPLARIFEEQFRTGARRKKLPSWVFTLPRPELIQFLRGYLEGDGNVYLRDNINRSPRVSFATVSENLGWQLFTLLTRFEILPSIYYRKNPNDIIQKRKVKVKRLLELYLTGQQSITFLKLIGYPIKILKQNKRSRTKFHNGYFLRKISRVEKAPYGGPVFNLEVSASNHAYSVMGAVVHNCIYPKYKQEDAAVTPLKESDAYPADCEDGYGWEKLISERMYKNFCEDYGLDVRIARYHNIMGPEGAYEGGREKAPAALCRKIALAQNPGEIEIWGDGNQSRSFCYIDDCLEGTYRLMESDFKEPLNIGSDRLVTINELADMITKISGKKITKKYNLSAPQGVRGRNADLTLVKKVLNWEPKISLQEGLEKTYQWIEERVRNKK